MRTRNNYTRRIMRNGFTLIEILVVLAVISLLASIVLASFHQVRALTRDSTRVQTLEQLQVALELHHGDRGYYPSPYGPGNEFSGCYANTKYTRRMSDGSCSNIPAHFSVDNSSSDGGIVETLPSEYFRELFQDPLHPNTSRSGLYHCRYVAACDKGASTCAEADDYHIHCGLEVSSSIAASDIGVEDLFYEVASSKWLCVEYNAPEC